ncbi:mycofactocin-coupled SDR family oxidoreductase [Mycolicibacterium frederiksbergense]|uniref:NAD(P)-dependent oxidoreductase n=1 Tax=Mycolicibacterium frederiksbergense TaxID=117567 RepID=A0A6H0RY26_9MYCO|nr:mycofactocin-coupled SDR family oxidoreductase [Mycolicibacterium frederiksbergense]QIV79816.1 NAD(P)-dependent oxidoreductase [Mycolicibacterium frederiksbergense]
MAEQILGKVAFVSGAARGIGRAVAIRLAQEGADVIAVDAAKAVPSQGGPAATPEDLAETVRMVEKLGRRIISRQADVSDLSTLTEVVEEGTAELGRLDIVVANAGVGGNPAPLTAISAQEWQNVLATNLTGMFNTARATVPHIISGGQGGSVVLVSSSMALRAQPGMGPYTSAKSGLAGLMQTLALELGEHLIRVNSVHPTTVRTPLLLSDANLRLFRPDLENPTAADAEPAFRTINVLPVPYVEPEDVANAVYFLASDEARYVTGVRLPVDAGYALK